MSRRMVVTDLDGTLLSHETYDWAPARSAVLELKRRGIPLVLASSKTRAEIELWRAHLRNEDPFIVENGGALFFPTTAGRRALARSLPPRGADEQPGAAVEVEGYYGIEFGTPYARLRVALPAIAREIDVPLRGYGEMHAEEITRHTGLLGEDLDRSRRREYDEPFVPGRDLSPEDESRMRAAAARRGLRVTRGARFYHLIGQNDKGTAVRRLTRIYAQMWGEAVTSMGLGDSANDLELLQAVERPVVVARPDGTHDATLRSSIPGALFARSPGPAGFAEAVLAFLGEPS